MNDERIKTFSKQVWNLMTDDEQNHFYYDVGTIGFVELTSKLLNFKPTEEALDAVLDELPHLDRPLDYIRDQIFDKAYDLNDEELSGLGCLLDEYIKGAK